MRGVKPSIKALQSIPRTYPTHFQSSPIMTTYLSPRLRYVSLALPLLVIVIVLGFGAHGAQATPHREGHELAPRSETPARDSSSIGFVKAPPSSSFFLNGLKGQRPQTRYYNFVVSEMNGAPDGVTKPMLVVNGKFATTRHGTLTYVVQVNGRVLPSKLIKAIDSLSRSQISLRRIGRE